MKDKKGKKSKATWTSGRILVVIAVILVIGSGTNWFFNQGSNKVGGSAKLAGVFYTPTVSSNKVSVPAESLKTDKLVFMDVKLETPQQQLTYKGRVIPLSDYRGGAYLPIVAIYTPQGNVISGIRVCEPCGSFSFHIVNGKLDCDLCHTEWDLETLKGISGGCQSYPPPSLPTTLSGNASIDLSPVGLVLA